MKSPTVYTFKRFVIVFTQKMVKAGPTPARPFQRGKVHVVTEHHVELTPCPHEFVSTGGPAAAGSPQTERSRRCRSGSHPVPSSFQEAFLPFASVVSTLPIGEGPKLLVAFIVFVSIFVSSTNAPTLTSFAPKKICRQPWRPPCW